MDPVAVTRESAGLVEAAEAFLTSISSFDPSRATPSECMVVSETAARVGKASEALRLVAAARAVAAGAHKRAGVADPALWLARQGGTTGKDARQGLELARSLESHPATKRALFSGAVSAAQAKEIVKAESELTGSEHELLDVARHGDLGAVRDAVREKLLRSTPVEDLHRRQLAARRFRHWRDNLGMVCFAGALTPAAGIPLLARLEREAARLYREERRTGDPEGFDAYAADALLALTAEQPGGKRGSRTDLVIVCDINAFRRGHTHDGETCHIIGGGPIPVEAAKELANDAFLKIVLHDGKDIMKVKHVGRRYTAELLTALHIGAAPSFSGRACVDCGRKGYGLERDHDDPIANTGPTSIVNLKNRCHPCHAEKTERDRKAGLLGRRAKAGGLGTGPPGSNPPGTGPPGTGPPGTGPPGC